MRKYKSEISSAIVILTTLVVLLMCYALYDRQYIILAILGVPSLFCASIFFNTHYKMDRTSLKIRGGFAFNETISIAKIKMIRSVKELTNAPALSINRLEIVYNDKTIQISPVDRDRFIADLKKINPDIVIDHKSVSR